MVISALENLSVILETAALFVKSQKKSLLKKRGLKVFRPLL